MYFFHVFVLIIIVSIIFWFFKYFIGLVSIKKLRVKYPFFRSKPIICFRRFIKIIFHHGWTTKAYTREGRKKVPSLYSLLNSIQSILIIAPIFMLIETGLSEIKLKSVSEGSYELQYGMLEEFRESFTTKNGKTYPARIKVNFEGGRVASFKLGEIIMTPKNAMNAKLNNLVGKGVSIGYFRIFYSELYIVGLEHKGIEFISMDRAIQEHESKSVSFQKMLILFLIGCVSGFLKFKFYGYRNFYKRIK